MRFGGTILPCRMLFGGTDQLNSFPQRRKEEGNLNCEDDLRTRDELKNELPQKGRPSQKERQT